MKRRPPKSDERPGRVLPHGGVIKRLLDVRKEEWPALAWSFLYFFALLCSYYIVRPMRDEMGIAGGVRQLQWLFTGTFVTMLLAVPLFGWVTRRFTPRHFLPVVYGFFIGCLLLFYFLFAAAIPGVWVARAFFVWASVFNLFIVSVFWSFMADIFDSGQAKRLFGVIAAGGTAGALTGPAITAVLVLRLGPANLLPFSAAFLGVAILCIFRLVHWRRSAVQNGPAADRDSAARYRRDEEETEKAMGGSIFAGFRLILRSPYLIRICFLMLLYTTLSTFLYFEQAHIIKEHLNDPARRTALFAAMDFAVNFLTLGLQLFLTGRIVKWVGLGWTLAVIPLVLTLGFLVLGVHSLLSVIIAVQVLRRAGNYAVMRPAREMLYVPLSKEEKYKSKNVIDTVVYRGGDAVSAWIFTGMRALGLSTAGIALAAAPLALIWAWIAFGLGRRHDQIAGEQA